jgi:Acylphosphatases
MIGDKNMAEMKRIIATVKGKVQRVGYRDWIDEIASSSGIKGFVENLGDKSVRVVAEGETQKLKNFIEFLYARDHPLIKVLNIDLEWEESRDEFEYFEIKYGEFKQEAFERIGDAAVYLRGMMKKQDKMLDKQDESLDKQDKMLDKQDETIEILKDVKEDTGQIKQDTALISSIKEDTGVMRNSLKSLEEIHKETIELHHKYDKLEKDVELIKDKLSIP